jgi:hypothetical protein
MTTVPNASGAIVASDKVRAFLLNQNHAGNKGRAGFFAGFGFAAARWEALRDALRAHVVANRVIKTETTIYGTTYTVRCSLPSPDSRNPCIFTIWIMEADGRPRLVTTFPGTPPGRAPTGRT